MSSPNPGYDADRIAAENLSRLEKLAATEEFQWFLETCVGQARTAADAALHDLKRTKEERDNDLHEWTALDRILKWPGEQAAMYKRALGHEIKLTSG